MIELVRQFLWDPTAAKRWLRGLLLAVGSLAALYSVNGSITKEMLLAAIPNLIAGLIGAGDKNPAKPPG